MNEKNGSLDSPPNLHELCIEANWRSVPNNPREKAIAVASALLAVALIVDFHFRPILFAVILCILVTAGVLSMRQRKRAIANLVRDLDMPLNDCQYVVEICLVDDRRTNQSPNWTDVGAMIVERDYIAYHSPNLSFLIGGQDLSEAVGSFYWIPSECSGQWVTELRLKANSQPLLRVSTLKLPGADSAVPHAFIHSVVAFRTARLETDEHRSLPPWSRNS